MRFGSSQATYMHGAKIIETQIQITAKQNIKPYLAGKLPNQKSYWRWIVEWVLRLPKRRDTYVEIG